MSQLYPVLEVQGVPSGCDENASFTCGLPRDIPLSACLCCRCDSGCVLNFYLWESAPFLLIMHLVSRNDPSVREYFYLWGTIFPVLVLSYSVGSNIF